MLNEPEIQLILQLEDYVIHYWETYISDSIYLILASTKEDFDNFSRFSSNYVFYSSTFDDTTTNSSSFDKDSTYSKVKSASEIELSTSCPHGFGFFLRHLWLILMKKCLKNTFVLQHRILRMI